MADYVLNDFEYNENHTSLDTSKCLIAAGFIVTNMNDRVILGFQ